MKPIPYREVRRKLLAAGFYEVAQTGSHVKFAFPAIGGIRTATVPRHREVAGRDVAKYSPASGNF
ncbi:MAG: type II toxin-antitoxin system HicA family toxin [Acidobacteria bacterium]|nr:type II toxin-antitoxin system HicA family toxin [Acidobacteriota bacterium]